MARPTNANAAETRSRILQSATLLFSEAGQKASVRQVAKGASVSVAMVHHYFGSKDELYEACIDAMYVELSTLRDAIAKDLATATITGFHDVLDRAVRTGFRFARERQRAMRLMMRQVVARGALDQGRVDEFVLPFLEQASALLAPITGRDAATLRLPLQSLIFLNGRYAIAEDSELMLVTAQTSPDAALAAVEDHLVDHAFATLGVPRPTTH